MDGGTLFQLRKLINRKNVRKDPADDVNACEDFFLTAIEGHILAAVMQEFDMSSLDDTPCASLFPKESSTLDPLQRCNVMITALQKVVKKLVDVAVPSTASEGDPQNQQTQNVSQKCNEEQGQESP